MVNYNRDLFDAAGVAYPERGWTWDQFRETAIALTVKDASGTVTQFGYEVPNQNFFVQPWFFTNGTAILNDDWTASNMLDPKVAETLQFLYDLIHVDGVSPIPGAEMMDSQFVAGQVAMINRGQWIVQNAKANDVNMDIAFPPMKEREATVIGFGAYAISAQTENPDLAQELVLELTSEATQREQGERGGVVPGRASAASTEAFLAFPPSANLYYETLPVTIPVPSPANFQEVEAIFIRHYIAMMSGEETIADGTAAADAELNESFARLKEQSGG
jgi:multiple sugar transport system substrate-binding protein